MISDLPGKAAAPFLVSGALYSKPVCRFGIFAGSIGSRAPDGGLPAFFDSGVSVWNASEVLGHFADEPKPFRAAAPTALLSAIDAGIEQVRNETLAPILATAVEGAAEDMLIRKERRIPRYWSKSELSLQFEFLTDECDNTTFGKGTEGTVVTERFVSEERGTTDAYQSTLRIKVVGAAEHISRLNLSAQASSIADAKELLLLQSNMADSLGDSELTTSYGILQFYRPLNDQPVQNRIIPKYYLTTALLTDVWAEFESVFEGYLDLDQAVGVGKQIQMQLNIPRLPLKESELSSLMEAVQLDSFELMPIEARPRCGGIYEAEQALLTGARSESARRGYTGSGYVHFTAPYDQSIVFVTTECVLGTYEVAWRYLNGGEDRPMRLLVNDFEYSDDFRFPSTVSWENWVLTARYNISLQDGINRIKLETNGYPGSDLDYMELLTVSAPNSVCSGMRLEAEGALGVADPTVATGVDSSAAKNFSGWGYANLTSQAKSSGRETSQLRLQVPPCNSAGSELRIGLRYALAGDLPVDVRIVLNNVTLHSLAADGTSEGLKLLPTGNWSTWATELTSNLALRDGAPNSIRIELASGLGVLVDYLDIVNATRLSGVTDEGLRPGTSVNRTLRRQPSPSTSAKARVGIRQVELEPTLYEDSTLLLLHVNTTHPRLCSRKYTICQGNLTVGCVDQNALERARAGPLPGDRYIRCTNAFLPCNPNSAGVTLSCLVKVIVEIGGLLGNLATEINEVVVSGAGIDRRGFWDSIVLMHDFRAEFFGAVQEAQPWTTLDCMGLSLTAPATSLSISFVDTKILVKRCIFSSRRLNSAAIHIQVWPSSCLLALWRL